MNWGQSYTATWRVFKVNADTWADGAILNNVDSISITRTADGNVMESGNMTVSGDFEDGYYRIAMTAEQGNEVARVDVGTFLCVSSSGTTDYGFTDREINCRSVLYPAETMAVTTGEYAPAGADGALYAANLLSSAINAPVVVEGSFILNNHLVHELGASVIDAVWVVLEAGGFVIQIDGQGTVHIRPKPTEPSLVINNTSTAVMLNGISYTHDTSELPNRYIVIEDNFITIASNDDPTSPISTVSRGYNVDVVDTSPTPVNGEPFAAYANNRLRELSIMKEERSYTREYAPNVYPYSIVRATLNSLDGDYRVVSQSIECGNGIVVTEKVAKEVSLWQSTAV